MTEILWKWRKPPKYQSTNITNNLYSAGVRVSESPGWKRLWEQQYRGYTTRCKALSSVVRIRRRDYNLQRSSEMSHKSSGTKFYGLIKTQNYLYQSDGKAKVWRKKGSAHDPNIQAHLWSTVEVEVSCLGFHGCFWSGLTNLYWWCNSWW